MPFHALSLESHWVTYSTRPLHIAGLRARRRGTGPGGYVALPRDIFGWHSGGVCSWYVGCDGQTHCSPACSAQDSPQPQQQKIIWPQIWTVLRGRIPALEYLSGLFWETSLSPASSVTGPFSVLLLSHTTVHLWGGHTTISNVYFFTVSASGTTAIPLNKDHT